jgi:hypothetical protein
LFSTGNNEPHSTWFMWHRSCFHFRVTDSVMGYFLSHVPYRLFVVSVNR